MSESVERRIEELRTDRERGASQLASEAIDLLKDACIDAAGEPEYILEEMCGVAQLLAAIRPVMAPIGAWAAEFCHRLKTRMALEDVPAELIIMEVADDLHREKAALLARQVEAAKNTLADIAHVMTLSYSSTVERILIEAAPPGLTVTVAESRPLLEGRKTADRLLDAGRNVRLVTDAQTGLAMKEADMAMVGADMVCRDLSAINKTGSYPLALAAREMGKPFIVAADTFKIDPSFTAGTAPEEKHAGAEVWDERPDICSNVYFEPTPAERISGYLTEKGLLSAEAMRTEVDKRRERFKAIYDSPAR